MGFAAVIKLNTGDGEVVLECHERSSEESGRCTASEKAV
jgi:hypothetical protein